MKLIIPGGTGELGTILVRAFREAGHTLVVLSRKSGYTLWDARTLGDWAYSVVARYRYRWFGRQTTCMVPSDEVRHRFIE